MEGKSHSITLIQYNPCFRKQYPLNCPCGWRGHYNDLRRTGTNESDEWWVCPTCYTDIIHLVDYKK
jgi:predicted SprT family Zn-dependent metalloprotease